MAEQPAAVAECSDEQPETNGNVSQWLAVAAVHEPLVDSPRPATELVIEEGWASRVAAGTRRVGRDGVLERIARREGPDSTAARLLGMAPARKSRATVAAPADSQIVVQNALALCSSIVADRLTDGVWSCSPLRDTLGVLLDNLVPMAAHNQSAEFLVWETLFQSPWLNDSLQKLIETGIPFITIMRQSRRLSAMILEKQSLDRFRLDAHLCGILDKSSLVQYAEICRYDETPIYLRRVADTNVFIKEANAASSSALVRSTDAIANIPPIFKHTKQDAAVIKLMQSHCRTNILLSVGGQFVCLRQRCLVSVQALEQNTAVCVRESQARASGATAASTRYQLKTRATCTDGASPLFLAERQLVHDRDGWNSVHSTCATHNAATIFGKLFRLTSTDVTGVVNTTLCLRDSASMGRYTSCVLEVVGRSFKVKAWPSNLSKAAQTYRRTIMQLYLTKGTNFQLRRAVLSTCLVGDWQSDEINWFVKHGPNEITDENVLRSLTQYAIVISLLSKQPHDHNRSKWLGFDLTLNDVGLLSAVHNIHPRAFRLFILSYQRPVADPGMLSIADEEDAGQKDFVEKTQLPETRRKCSQRISQTVCCNSCVSIASQPRS